MPSSFTSKLVVTKIGTRSWALFRDLEYHVGHEGSDNRVLVPKGFITDFASIPRPFWIIFPPDGEYTAAAVVHDFLYNSQSRTRKQSDEIFLEAMQVLKVNLFKRLIIYRAVRTFGWIPWNNHAKELSHLKLTDKQGDKDEKIN